MVVPLRSALRRARVVVGDVERVDAEHRLLHLRGVDGDRFEMPFDQLVLTPGSRSRTLPVPGLAHHGIGFKTLGEAILLRNHVLSRLEAASQRPHRDPRRRAALTFVFVGAGYAGVEALGELEDLSRWALKHMPEIGHDEPRWMLVEARDEILPEIGGDLGTWAARELAERGIEIKTGTRLDSVEGGVVRLSDGETFPAETLVWTAGVKAEPLAALSDLPIDDHGTTARRRRDAGRGPRGRAVGGRRRCGRAGPGGGGLLPAVGAVRHAAGQATRRERAGHDRGAATWSRSGSRRLGALCSLGRYRGVAVVMGVHLRGFPAWFVTRSYHLLQLPTLNRKVRVVLDWTLSLFFPRDVAALGIAARPHRGVRASVGGLGHAGVGPGVGRGAQSRRAGLRPD